jgi:pyridoxamine 5'-phosphate oxidase family protein
MAFTDQEIAYMKSQRLARLATVSSDDQPDVVPVAFEFDGTHFYVGGVNPARTRKFLNVADGHTKVSLVIDDLVSTSPWTPRYFRVYGTAQLIERQGQFGNAPYMRITPIVSWSWNLEGVPFSHDHPLDVKRTNHSTDQDSTKN